MSIRIRITLVTLGVIVLVSGILVVAAYLAQQASESRYIEASLSGKRVLLDQIMARHASEMKAFTKAMTRDRTTLKALRDGDRKILQEQVDTTHNLFTSDGTLDRLQVLDTSGAYLASAPQRFSGTSGKGLVLQAAREGKLVHGLALDDDGTLQAALAFPLYARGKLKGVAFYSRGIQRILDDFQLGDQADVFVLDNNGRILSAAGENQLEQPAVSARLDASGGMEVVRDDGAYRVVTTVPMHNRAGEVIATLLTSQDQTETYGTQARVAYVTLILVSLALLLSAVGIVWYFRRVFRPIDRVITSMTEIAEGNLGCTIEALGANDETGRLSRALATMVDQLRSLVIDITESTERLSTSVGELTRIAGQGTDTIARQRQETDQVATAVNEMASTVQEVARSAAEAASATGDANQKAAEGQAIVLETITSVDGLAGDIRRSGEVISRLKGKSENIGSVLDVIRGIAEQTNLLALNAAIEAARAGEQGRGFAVVADEVRTLASRTQQSTEEIQHMIEDLQSEAEDAVRVMEKSQSSSSSLVTQATRAEEALRSIAQSVEKINDMNTQIATAAEQQSTVAEMINSSVVNIAQGSEGTEQMTQHTVRAAEELKRLGERLNALVHKFNT